jgi:hypothetical protein
MLSDLIDEAVKSLGAVATVLKDGPRHDDAVALAGMAERIKAMGVTPDLLAAREMAADGLSSSLPYGMEGFVFDLMGAELMRGGPKAIAAAFRSGRLDRSKEVQTILSAINHGRAQRETPDRLTVTIDGPQGSGKTQLADHLNRLGWPIRIRPAYEASGIKVDPRIIEIRDGRSFDVRADEFLEA